MNSLLEQTKKAIQTISGFSYSGPSMLTDEEKAFYYLLGSKLLTLEGVVVDAGCWLGSSSFYIGKGIECNSRFSGDQIIYTCDIFRWDKNHDLQIKNHSVLLANNDDFQFLTIKYLESLKLKVITKKIDYSISAKTIIYHTGEPIEALMVDAGKTPELLFNILEGYLPYCIENKTIIFFQEYRDYWCWFIPPIVNFLENIMEPVIHLKNGGSGFCFRNKEQAMKLLQAAREMFMESTQLEKYYDKAIVRVGKAHKEAYFQMKANRIALSLHNKKVTEAYYGSENRIEQINTEYEKVLLAYIKQLDSVWPTSLIDSSLQNAYRRVRHAANGKKDLTLNFKSIHFFKRRIFNPIYAKIILKRLLK
jgi:hypothetical protein